MDDGADHDGGGQWWPRVLPAMVGGGVAVEAREQNQSKEQPRSHHSCAGTHLLVEWAGDRRLCLRLGPGVYRLGRVVM